MRRQRLFYPDGKPIELGDWVWIDHEQERARILMLIDTEDLRVALAQEDFGVEIETQCGGLELMNRYFIIEYGFSLIARDPPSDPDFLKVKKIRYADGKVARYGDTVGIATLGRSGLVTMVYDSKRKWGLPPSRGQKNVSCWFEGKLGLAIRTDVPLDDGRDFLFVERSEVRRMGITLITRGEQEVFPRKRTKVVPPEKRLNVVKLPHGLSKEGAKKLEAGLSFPPIGSYKEIACMLLKLPNFRVGGEYVNEETDSSVQIELFKLLGMPCQALERLNYVTQELQKKIFRVIEGRPPRKRKWIGYVLAYDPVRSISLVEKSAPVEHLFYIMQILEPAFGPLVFCNSKGQILLPEELLDRQP